MCVCVCVCVCVINLHGKQKNIQYNKRHVIIKATLNPSTLCMSLRNPFTRNHGPGDSTDTTCAVVRDVTAYIAVVRVFRFPSEYYGCRYHQCRCFNVHRAKIPSLFSAIIKENCQEGIYRYFQRVSNFLNI